MTNCAVWVLLAAGAAAEYDVQAATEKYLSLLDEVNWLGYVEGRVMASGWLGAEHQYATWGDGTTLQKRNDTITFHRTGTGDNDGIFTAPVLQGVCHALKIWPDMSDRLSPMLERLINGLSSWVQANRRGANDTAPTILARNLYPPASESSFGGYRVVMEYDAVRVAGGGTFSERVHVPENPYWGDLWIEAMRSKDDIGHIFRGIALVLQPGGCLAHASKSLKAAADRMRSLYAAWAAQVESDDWKIATLNANQEVVTPSSTDAGTAFAFIRVGNVECTAPLAMRMLAKGGEGKLSCGDGISLTESAARNLHPSVLKNDNIEIFRTSHEAACAMSLLQGRNATAQKLCPGLTTRVDWSMDHIARGKYPSNWHSWDLTSLILHSSALGVDLSDAAASWFDTALNTTRNALAQAPQNIRDAFRVFDVSVGDGDYAFMPTLPRQAPGTLGMADGEGLKIEDLAVPLGACASAWRGQEILLDCDAVRAWQPKSLVTLV